MNAQQLAEYLTETLRSQRLLDSAVVRRVLEFPSGFRAEVVLKDGTKLEDARRLMDSVQVELREKGVELDWIVRAQWDPDGVKKVAGSQPPGLPAGPSGLLFHCTVRSGARSQEVWVDVTPSAYQVLLPLGATDQALENSVRDFLRHRLSVGGPGYWDPIRDSRLELDSRAAQYLRWRPYQQLKGAVDLAFRSRENACAFLKGFQPVGKKASGNFTGVLEELAGPGGSIARGEHFPTTNTQLYELLLDTEKKELEAYYRQRLSEARSSWPELDRDFSDVLGA